MATHPRDQRMDNVLRGKLLRVALALRVEEAIDDQA
jgi:hypothetical protein